MQKSPYDIYIGRGSKWGNPFRLGVDGDRKEVIEKYRKWIIGQTHLIRDLPELRGKILGCWCYPNDCHGNILAKMAEAL